VVPFLLSRQVTAERPALPVIDLALSKWLKRSAHVVEDDQRQVLQAIYQLMHAGRAESEQTSTDEDLMLDRTAHPVPPRGGTGQADAEGFAEGARCSVPSAAFTRMWRRGVERA
jgi:hypothetical protein